MSVRHLWAQAEAARGELPHVPFLPPLPKAAGGAAAAAVGASQRALRQPHPPPRVAEGGEEAEEGVGAYLDGGVMGGSGADEGGLLGPSGGLGLPERLEDL